MDRVPFQAFQVEYFPDWRTGYITLLEEESRAEWLGGDFSYYRFRRAANVYAAPLAN
jgi:hypothetical protein